MSMNNKKVNHLIKDQKHLNKVLALQRNNDIIAMLLDGKTTHEIATFIVTKYRIKRGTATTFITECRGEIKARRNFEVNNVISTNIDRYEWLYAKCMEIGNQSLAMSSLKHKEKLMQFHREGFHMRVSQGQIQQIQQTHIDDEYDKSKLSAVKQQRFLQLLQKAKRNEHSAATKLIQ